MTLTKIILKQRNFQELLAYPQKLRDRAILNLLNPTTPFLVGTPKSEGMMTMEYARIKGFSVVFVERSSACADLWEEQIKNDKNMKVERISAEEYLVTRLGFSSKKTLVYFNFSGDRDAREFYSKASLESVKAKLPHSTISFIITEEFTNPTTKASNYLELLRAFGIDTAKHIRTIEDYLNAYGFKFKILWEKKTTRRVALVRLF